MATPSLTRTKVTVIVISIAVLISAITWFVLAPQRMSSDLSRVGDGLPTVVLTYENYSPASMDAIERLNRVRGDFDEQVEFVVADVGTAAGDEFAREWQTRSGVISLFAADGEHLGNGHVPEDERALRDRIERELLARSD